jgi:hypothetical protein
MATMIPSDIEEFGTEGEKASNWVIEFVGLLGSQTSMKDKIGGRGDAVRRR